MGYEAGFGLTSDQGKGLMVQGGKMMMTPQPQGQQMPPPVMQQRQRPQARSFMTNAQGQPIGQLRSSRLF
jgi:hypothetical protein